MFWSLLHCSTTLDYKRCPSSHDTVVDWVLYLTRLSGQKLVPLKQSDVITPQTSITILGLMVLSFQQNSQPLSRDRIQRHTTIVPPHTDLFAVLNVVFRDSRTPESPLESPLQRQVGKGTTDG